MRKKKQSSIPRRKRLSRKGRLTAGKKFIEQYRGKKLIVGYAKWFAVSPLCAAIELKMLGEAISDHLIEHYRNTELKKAEQKKLKKAEMMQETPSQESDHYFAYIAGYTSNGVPYGVTWDDWEISEE